MRKDFSPEERLLRLIKGAKKKETTKPEESTPKIEPPQGKPEFSKVPQAPREIRPAPDKAISVSLPIRLKEINTRPLNSALIIVLVFILLYFTGDLFYTAYVKKGESDIIAEVDSKIAKIEKEETLDIKPYSYYSSSIEGRNIFMPPEVETEPVVTGPSLEEVMAGLSLIGIIAGERPQAIVEDRKTGKSHFLYEGNFIGEVKVVTIKEGSVIMEYQSQRFELVL